MKQFLMVLGCLIGLLGCQAERDKASLFGPEEVGVLVIDAQLIVDKPLPALFVRETVGLGEVYRLGEAGVNFFGLAQNDRFNLEKLFQIGAARIFSIYVWRSRLPVAVILPAGTQARV